MKLRTTASKGGLVVLLLGIAMAGRADGDGAAWSVAESATAIRRFVSDAAYPLEYIGDFENPNGRAQALFEGLKNGFGSSDRFWVDRGRRMIVSAFLWSRTDSRYSAIDFDPAEHDLLDLKEAEQRARALVQERCPALLQAKFRYEADVDWTPYVFTWERLSPEGVRLPEKVTVQFDPLTKQLCGWRRTLREVVVDLPPRLTTKAAATIAAEVAGDSCGPLREIYAAVIGRGDTQRVVWYAFHEVDGVQTCVIVEDATGEAFVLR